MLRSDAVEVLVEAMERTAAGVGIKDPYAFGAALHAWLQKNEYLLKAFCSREELRECLSSLPDEVAVNVPAFVGILAVMPKIIKSGIMNQIRAVAQANPKVAATGRRAGFDDAQKRTICDEIAVLIRHGTTVKDAQQRLARRCQCSFRAIQRIWGQRRLLSEDEPNSLTDLMSVIDRLG